MGREIRRVPPTWEHPQTTVLGKTGYQPLFDQDYDSAAATWLRRLLDWEANTDGVRTEAQASRFCTSRYFWDWDGPPPDKKYYRPAWTPEEATAFQMYETVSEGTPVTPVFATKQALVEYLVVHGTFWDNGQGWNRDAAERMVHDGWAPSLILWRTSFGTTIAGPREMTREIMGAPVAREASLPNPSD